MARRETQTGPTIFDGADAEETEMSGAEVSAGADVPVGRAEAADGSGVSEDLPAKLVVCADGGSRGNPGPAAYGAVVLDGETGEVLNREGLGIGTNTNNVAEYSGLVAGLEMARAINPAAAVEVRMDSKLVVEQMSGRWKIKHPAMKELAAKARGLCPSLVKWTWVPRADNKIADGLVNAALDGKPSRRNGVLHLFKALD